MTDQLPREIARWEVNQVEAGYVVRDDRGRCFTSESQARFRTTYGAIVHAADLEFPITIERPVR